MNTPDHLVLVLIAFVTTLACFTTVSIIGTPDIATLRDVLLALAGALGGLAVGKTTSGP